MLGQSDVAMSDPEADVSKSGSPAPRRSARNTTKEVPKAAKLKRKAREESDEDAMDSGEDHSGSGSDGGSDAEEPVPSRRRAPAEKKTTTAAAAKRQRAADTDDDGFVKPAPRPAKARAAPARNGRFDGDSIFKVIAGAEGSLDASVGDWLASYNVDKTTATCDLLNFILQSAGYPRNSVDVSVLEDPDTSDISEILQVLNMRIENGEIKNEEFSTQDYPLISRKYAAKRSQPGEPNKFAKGLRQWWIKWIDRMRQTILQPGDENEEDGTTSEAYAWEVLKVYVLTLSSSPMRHVRHTATCIALALCSGLCNAGRKAADEQSSLQRQAQADKAKTGKRYENLQERMKELEQQRKKIDEQSQEIFNTVFVHRYRDVDALIRSDCVRELGYWIKTYHETFLDPNYLRYCGWMLSDKAPRTRLPSITFLRDVLNDPQAEITFIPGLRPFLERFRPRLLDIAKRDVDRKNREEAVQVVVEGAIMGVLGEEEETEEALLPLIVNESEVVRKTVARFFVHSWKAASEELAPEDSDSTTKTHAQLKSLAQTMSRAFQLASSRSDETLFTEEHVPLVGELGPYYKREVETSSLLSIEGVYRMSLAFEALAEADEWSGEVLQDWKDILRYLLQDFSVGQQTSNKRKGQQQKELSPFALSNEEENTMMCLLGASIDATRNADDKNDDDAENARIELSRKLAEDVSKLFGKYQTNPRCLALAVSLVRRIDPETWFNARMLKTHDSLVDDLYRIFVKNPDPTVLAETARAFRHLLSNASAASMNVKETKGRRKSSTNNAAETEIAAFGSVRRKIGDVCEELFMSSLDPLLTELADSINLDSSAIADVVARLHACIRRWDSLFGNINVPEAMRSVDLPDDKDLADAFAACAERTLDVLSKLEDRAGVDGPLSVALQDISMISIEVLFRDMLYEALLLRETLHLRKPTDDIESQSVSGAASEAGDESAAADQAKRLQGKIVRMTKLSAKLIEGITVESPLSVKATAIKAFSGAATLALSDIALHCPLARATVETTAKALGDVVPKLVDTIIAQSSGVLPFNARGLDDEEDDDRVPQFPDPALHGTAAKLVRLQLNLFVSQVAKMIRDHVLPDSAAASLLKWVGVADEYDRVLAKAAKESADPTDRINGPKETVLQAVFWDKVITPLLSNQMVRERGRSAFQITAAAQTSKAQAEALAQIRREIQQTLDDIVVGSFDESLGMFTMGQIPSLDHTIHLARHLAADIKAWNAFLQPGKIATSKREVGVEHLVGVLFKIGAAMVDRAGAVVAGSADVAPSLRGRKHLAAVNDGWRACNVLANGIMQALCLVSEKKGAEAPRMDDKDRKDLYRRIAEDAIAPLKARLSEKGLKPQQTPDWEGYQAFVRLLEGKQTDADRKKANRVASVAPSREGTPAVKAGKTRSRKPLQFKAADEVEDELEAELPNAKSKAAKSRSKTAARRQADTGSDEEEEADEIESAGQPSPAPSSGAGHSEDEAESEEPVRPRRPRREMALIEVAHQESESDSDEEELEPIAAVMSRGAKKPEQKKRKDTPDSSPEVPKKKIRIGM